MTNTKYILTIGLNDKDTYTQKFDTITAYKMIEQILQPRTNGYIMYETHGGYWSNVRTLDQKAKTLTTCQSISNSGATNVKYASGRYYKLSPVECERLQTLPDNYTLAGGGEHLKYTKIQGDRQWLDGRCYSTYSVPFAKRKYYNTDPNINFGFVRTDIGGVL